MSRVEPVDVPPEYQQCARELAASARQHETPCGYTFGNCEINLLTRQLFVAGVPRHTEPKTFDLLVYILTRRHRVVTKQELRCSLWDGCALSSGAITQCVWTARKAIGDTRGNQRLIQTLHRLGYRFIGEVIELTVAPQHPC